MLISLKTPIFLPICTDSANYSSDAASGWEDQNNDTIDIIPNESPDDFSEDDGSWESGDSGF